MNSIAKRQDLGLALIRIVVGLVFLVHGWQKLFVYGHAGVTGAMAQMGIPFPSLSAYLVSFTEFLGGLALLLGVLTRLIAIPIAFQMLVAIAAVHFKSGFFLPSGYEYAMTLFVASVGLAIAGGGAFAIDNVLFRTPGQPGPVLHRAA